jgi:hypothetical protein
MAATKELSTRTYTIIPRAISWNHGDLGIAPLRAQANQLLSDVALSDYILDVTTRQTAADLNPPWRKRQTAQGSSYPATASDS